MAARTHNLDTFSHAHPTGANMRVCVRVRIHFRNSQFVNRDTWQLIFKGKNEQKQVNLR